MIKQATLALLAVILIAFPAIAQEDNSTITLQVIPVAPEVEIGGTATFKLAITNMGPERDVFKISGDPSDISPFSPAVQYIQFEPNQIKLDPDQMKEVDVKVKILENAEPDDEHRVDVTVSSLSHTENEKSTSLKVFVLSNKDVVQMSANAPSEVTPGENYELSVLFKNRLNSFLEGYEISVYSDLPGISKSFFANFSAKEEREEYFSFPISLNAAPGDYALNVKAYSGSDLKGSYSWAFKVNEKSSIGEQKAEKGGFLKSTTTITKRNDGNVKSTQSITIESSFLKNIFTSTKPDAKTRHGDLTWEFSLAPGEEYTVTVERNYRPIFYGFVIIVLAVILIYFHIERSVVIKKRIFMIRSNIQGLSEMKILLIVRNGRMKQLQGVKVMDVLPNIIQPTHEFGTLKPDSVQQGAKGKRFVWEIGNLEPGEERVLTYKVKAKLHLDGGALLPPAMMQYEKDGSFMTVVSKRLDVGPQPLSMQES
mgnify:CR=1 FL=1